MDDVKKQERACTCSNSLGIPDAACRCIKAGYKKARKKGDATDKLEVVQFPKTTPAK